MNKLLLGIPFVIIGSINWKVVDKDKLTSQEIEISKSVGLLLLDGARCTAFKIAKDTIMTNSHCADVSPQGTFIPDYTYKNRNKSLEELKGYNCILTHQHAPLDFAIYNCKGISQVKTVTLCGNAKVKDSIYAVSQNCDYYTTPDCKFTKIVSPGSIIGESTDSFAHSADTLGGSSGAAVFSKKTSQVVALHNSGNPLDDKGRGDSNFAIKMKLIMKALIEWKVNFLSCYK